MSRGKIFIIDDERTIRLTFRLALETDGYDMQEAASADEARTAFRAERCDLVVLDLRLGEDSGLDVLAGMRQCGIQTPTLMITAYGSVRNAVRAMQLGAIDFLEKPVEPVALRQMAGEIISRHRPRPVDVAPGSFADCLREAKRLINLQEFDPAADKIVEALRLDRQSPDAHNLKGVLHEICGGLDGARKAYGRAIKLDSHHEAAQQNMRRLFELFNFGRSEEPLHFGEESCPGWRASAAGLRRKSVNSSTAARRAMTWGSSASPVSTPCGSTSRWMAGCRPTAEHPLSP